MAWMLKSSLRPWIRNTDGGVQNDSGLQVRKTKPYEPRLSLGSTLERVQIESRTAVAIRYDGQYTYAARIDPDRATSQAQQYSKGSGSPARSLSEVREPERADYRPLGILSDSVFPV
jgi:hypothetical protein